MLLHYVLQGEYDAPETGVESSLELQQEQDLTLAQLKDLFPYCGTFHFRLKVADNVGTAPHVWLDLTQEGDDIVELARNLGGIERAPRGSHEVVHVKVLPLSFDAPALNGGDDALPPDQIFDWNEDAGAAAPVAAAAAQTPAYNVEDAFVRAAAARDDAREFAEPPYLGSGGGGASRSALHASTQGQRHVRRPSGGSGGGGEGGSRHCRRPSGGSEHAVSPFDSPAQRRPSQQQQQQQAAQQQAERRGSGMEFQQGGDDDSAQTWTASVNSTITSAINSRAAQDLKQAAKFGLGNARKFLSKINKGGVGGTPPSTLPPVSALATLDDLSHHLETPFNDGVRSHFELLSRLWGLLFPDAPPLAGNGGAVSPRWREAGFQADSVDGDLDHTGTLCLRCMVTLLSGADGAALLHANAARAPPRRYPFAVVARNVTLMLADVLRLGGRGYCEARAPYWGLFERADAFEQLFCWAFRRLDAVWAERNASRDAFGQVIGQVKGELEGALGSGPETVAAFLERAAP
eukprot:TRINITY_DN6007_c0_g1_i1.p1 TRINITY_DN6007_c0_g1~~TRINITY_DN6007_c0_g1_i1.p1  ORF type:complete len:519 (+),score=212.05 TRINITY_DN6007_c0_g1_i1:29-1585(+)